MENPISIHIGGITTLWEKNFVYLGNKHFFAYNDAVLMGYKFAALCSSSIIFTMSTSPDSNIEFRNPYIAGLLAWLFPGLGHFYQGRKTKALIFCISIVPIFLIGAYLGSHREYGVARNVYFAWEPTGLIPGSMPRLYFIPQACIGSVAIPAFLQAKHVESGGSPFANNLMAPPAVFDGRNRIDRPTIDDIISKLQTSFEIGLIFTVIAGLMNLLAIFDAVDGPAVDLRKKGKITLSDIVIPDLSSGNV